VRLPAQLSRGPVNKIVHQLIQWQLTEFSRVEKRQSAANPSPPEDEFASFYVTTALYDLVLLLIEADAQTRRAPRHTDFTTQSQHMRHGHRSWTDILLATLFGFAPRPPCFSKVFAAVGHWSLRSVDGGLRARSLPRRCRVAKHRAVTPPSIQCSKTSFSTHETLTRSVNAKPTLQKRTAQTHHTVCRY